MPQLAKATGDPQWADATVDLIAGGKSNLTYRLTSAAGQAILRRPPEGDLLPKAHDMGREVRVQRALAQTPVPVPRILLADDGDLLGVPCYIMEAVEGHVIRTKLPPGYADSVEARVQMSCQFVDTLAAIHSVDLEATGLDTYGRAEGFMARQVQRWTNQWNASKSGAIAPVDELSRRLADQVPRTSHTTLIHGDYRIDNVVYHLANPGQINAVLDWELSTIGDPMTDLALLLLFWRADGDPDFSLIPAISHLPGFSDRGEMLDRYAQQTGRDLLDLPYHQAFAHFKFAAIAQGVAARSAAGTMAGQSFGDLGEQIRGLAERGLNHLSRS